VAQREARGGGSAPSGGARAGWWRQLRRGVAHLASVTRFASAEHTRYAQSLMVDETRSGVRTLCLVFLLPLLASALFAVPLGLDRNHVYTCVALSALALHLFVSSRAVREIEALYLLGMTLLVVTGTAFVLLAHRTGAFSTALFSSVGLIFMAVPTVPWGLREASLVTLLVYGLFSASTWSMSQRFDHQTLWTLQLYMLAAACVSLTLVARGARIRKQDIVARFELEHAHREMERQSLQDALTGCWNRRFLERELGAWLERAEKSGTELHFGLIDVDAFKQLNDEYGHAYGDQVLCWVVRGLEMALEQDGFVARVGGDEFSWVLVGDDPELRVERAGERLREASRAEGRPGGPRISFSVGIVSVPDGRRVGLDDLYTAADNALYEAKGRRDPEARDITAVRLTLGGVQRGERPCS